MSVAESQREKSLGIIIMSSHENYFCNLLDILEIHNGEITVFTTEEYRTTVSEAITCPNAYQWVTKSKIEPISQFLSRASEIWNQSVDILLVFPFYGGLSVTNEYYKLNFDCKYVQMIYNVNRWICSNMRLTPKVTSYIDSLLRKQLLSRADGVIVEFTPIKDYFDSKTVNCQSHVFVPLLFKGTIRDVSKYCVTIPGHINSSRRDYSFVLETLDSELQDYRDKLELHLLGSPQSATENTVIERCDNLISSGWDITYYDSWVPVQEFDQVLRKTSLLVAPMQKYKTIQGTVERYGLSKGSGSFGDAISYGKPLALPAYYTIPAETEAIVKPYTTRTDLAEIVQSCVHSGGLSATELVHVEKHFSMERQRERLYEMLSQITQ